MFEYQVESATYQAVVNWLKSGRENPHQHQVKPQQQHKVRQANIRLRQLLQERRRSRAG
jgi:hypothetical protein